MGSDQSADDAESLVSETMNIDLQGKTILQPISATEQVAAAVDREMHKFVDEANKAHRFEMTHEPLPVEGEMQTNRSGLKDALAALKDRAAISRKKAMEAGEKIEAAFKRQAEATDSLNRHADEMTREADDVLAELGQFSNGAPE